jgi:hypothetical protein
MSEGSQTILGSSLSGCPRRVPYRRGTRCDWSERHVRGGGRCVGVAAEGVCGRCDRAVRRHRRAAWSGARCSGSVAVWDETVEI